MKFLTNLLAKFDKKTQTKYVSEIDRAYPQKSASQVYEINNQQRINYLRDHAVKSQDKNKIWTEF
jgi:hypothetical protein